MDHGGNGKCKIEASLDIHRVVLFWLSLTVLVLLRQVSFSRMSGIEFVSRKAEREDRYSLASRDVWDVCKSKRLGPLVMIVIHGL